MRENPKPFKTVDEQVEILESRGITFVDKEDAAKFLLKENYYVVINGYKDAFLNKEASNLAHGEDRYESGTPFEYFKAIYSFDKALREETMRVLLEAETAMKTATVYAFCAVHGEIDDYLDPACYCEKQRYRNKDYYTKGLIRLLSTLQNIRDNRPHKQYLSHYIKNHKCLPLWVAAKCMTFGNMSAFFDYQQQAVKTKACVALARSLNKDTVRQKALASSFHVLPDFRNICAHDERLYCAKTGERSENGFTEMLVSLRTVVREDTFRDYIQRIVSLLDDVAVKEPEVEKKILRGMNTTRGELCSLLESVHTSASSASV